MTRKFLALAISTALATPTTALAQSDAPRVFESSAPWALDYGDDYCRLIGTFADGDDEVFVAFERIHPSNQVRLAITGEAFKMYRNADTLTYRLLPSGSDAAAPYLVEQRADGSPTLYLGNITMGEPIAFGAPGEAFVIPPYSREDDKAFAAGVTGLAFTSGLVKPVTVNTGKMSAPIGALQGCADDLLQIWGLDVEKHQTMTSPAVPSENASEWLPSRTIGFGEFSSLSGSRNTIRVMIDAAGKPTDCQIQWPSLKQKTNEKICKALLKKGKFTPAKDAEGNAFASYWMVEPFALMFSPD